MALPLDGCPPAGGAAVCCAAPPFTGAAGFLKLETRFKMLGAGIGAGGAPAGVGDVRVLCCCPAPGG